MDAIAGRRAAHAQALAVAAVNGVVSDSSGKVMFGVPVTLIQAETQAVHNGVTGAQGDYDIGNLPPGPYVLDVKAPGFKDYRQSALQDVRPHAPLAPGWRPRPD